MKRNSKNLREYKKLCLEIWEEREHECEFCGIQIGVWDMDRGEAVPKYENFQHIKKGRHEGEWNNKENIKLICLKCHAKQDSGLNLKI